jgi:hypothetical protein
MRTVSALSKRRVSFFTQQVRAAAAAGIIFDTIILIQIEVLLAPP